MSPMPLALMHSASSLPSGVTPPISPRILDCFGLGVVVYAAVMF